MIPKRIHYCWFGGNPLPDQVGEYIDTWKKNCPDYEIIEWNESNFDITANDYCREAYEAKKWAFVTDYVRLKVLYEHGGIYMDTDVEVCKNLDSLLCFAAVSGYESDTSIPTGTLAACRDNEWIGMLLRDYDNRHFLRQDGSYDMITNVKVITRLTTEKYGIELDGTKKVFGDNCVLLPFDYLCAKSFRTGEVTRTENTLTIHHFAGSWVSAENKLQQTLYRQYWQKLTWIPSNYFRHSLALLLSVQKSQGTYKMGKYIFRKIRRLGRHGQG